MSFNSELLNDSFLYGENTGLIPQKQGDDNDKCSNDSNKTLLKRKTNRIFVNDTFQRPQDEECDKDEIYNVSSHFVMPKNMGYEICHEIKLCAYRDETGKFKCEKFETSENCETCETCKKCETCEKGIQTERPYNSDEDEDL